MHAASAKSAYGVRFGDYKLYKEATSIEWESEENQELWLAPKEVGLVKVAVLRFSRSQMRHFALEEALNSRGTSVCEAELFGLEGGLEKLGGVLKNATCTWEQAVAAAAGWLDEIQLEAVVSYYHHKLAQAKLTEAEIAGAQTAAVLLLLNL